MDEAMILRGFALRTREAYLAAVSALAKYYRRAPDSLTPEDIQTYLLHLIVERKLSYSTVNQAASACRFLFDKVLRRPQCRFDIPMAKISRTLPRVLSRDEVKRLFEAAPNLRARALLMTTYAAGLRVSEVCALQLADIESAPDRMCIKVRQGKGAKDRYTMLSPQLLQTLRDYWHQRRPRIWLFPSPTGNGGIDHKVAQRIYGVARDRAGLGRVGGIHTLRHCFATHLLESGVDIHTIQRLLGHGHVSTTMRYFHLAQNKLTGTTSPLELLDTVLR
jgi:site-specific recombinase XerD